MQCGIHAVRIECGQQKKQFFAVFVDTEMLTSTVALFAQAFSEPAAPHILFIVADDFGYNDIGYHQSTPSVAKPHPANPSGRATTDAAAGVMPTPTLDKLAAEGTKLEMYYVQPLCSPTRATIMTGRYPFHTGLGPDVICTSCGDPYGLPAREVLAPALLSAAGYATAAIGKWHLGDCDERYLPTFRGFDHFMGYMSGAQSYYHHSGDFRNGSAGDGLPPCVGASVANNYSTLLYADEAARIVRWHAESSSVADDGSSFAEPTSAQAAKPLFLYLAFQSVHNPYDVPPPSIVDVNATFPKITNYNRRIYAGMVQCLDDAVASVVHAFQAGGLWDDTVLIFTTDNGGIEIGNNFPLRGMKVLTWEGGVRGVSFVRGTNSNIAKVKANVSSVELMHSTDWLPTLAHLANLGATSATPAATTTTPTTIDLVSSPAAADGSESGSAMLRPGGKTVLRAKIGDLVTLPLDGYDQWASIASGGAIATTREILAHNVPAKASPVLVNATSNKYGTSTCISYVDADEHRLKPDACGGFGIVGGAIRKGKYKLVWSFSNSKHPSWTKVPRGISSNSPVGVPQYTPGGMAHKPANLTVPTPVNGSLYLFDIVNDPTESFNLATTTEYMTSSSNSVANLGAILAELVALRDALEAAPDTVGDLGWQFGFRDPTGKEVDECMGPKTNSSFCGYGHEFACSVAGALLQGGTIGHAATPTPNATACREACRAVGKAQCGWWQLEVPSGGGGVGVSFAARAGLPAGAVCSFKATRGGSSLPCPEGLLCAYGPRTCPQ